MKRYRALQIVAAFALAVELAVGLGGTLTARREIFPFASWFLFSLVPYRTTEFDLILLASGDDARPLDPPRAFGQAGGLVRQPHSVVAYNLIQQLGRADAARDAATSRTLRRQIEAQFAVPIPRYELVRVTYAPVERWQTGRVLATEPLRAYANGEP